MKTLILLLSGLALSPIAMAQAPLDLSSLGLGNIATSVGASAAKYTVSETASTRFPDSDAAGPTFTAGERVEILFEEGDRVRVRAGNKYGWFAASLLSDIAPTGAAGAAPTLNFQAGSPPGLPPGVDVKLGRPPSEASSGL